MRKIYFVLCVSLPLLLISCEKEVQNDKELISESKLLYQREEPKSLSEVDKSLSYLCSKEFEGRRAGRPGGIKARGYIDYALQAIGLSTQLQPFSIHSSEDYCNIYLDFKGEKDSLVIIGAHYDGPIESTSDTHFPAANDNASGTATLLYLAKLLSQNSSNLEYNTRLCFFDAEESTESEILNGSTYFCKRQFSSNNNSKVKFYLNLDGVGYYDKENTIKIRSLIKNENNITLWNKILGIKNDLKVTLEKDIGAKTNLDTYPFYKNNIDYVYFSNFSEQFKNIHSPDDKLEYLSFKKMKDLSQFILIFLNK